MDGKRVESMSMKIIVNSIIFCLVLVSCSKKRSQTFPHREGEDLLAISDYDGKTMALFTGNALSSDQHTEASEGMTIEGDQSIIRDFELLNYQSNSPHIEGVPIRGKKHHTYSLLYELDEKYLKIYKVGYEKDLPTQEMTYATKLSSGQYKVPLVGYPITSYYIIEQRENEDGEKSHILRETAVENKKDATHFKVNFDQRIVFEAIKKQDVFKKEILEGDWFYASTVIAADKNRKNMIGLDLSVDTNRSPVSRVKFENLKDRIRAINKNIDPNIDSKDILNYDFAVEIPVQWLEYKIADDGVVKGLNEKEVIDGDKDAKPWKSREFVKMDFSNVSTPISKTFGSGVLENLVISSDKKKGSKYISFTVDYGEVGIKVRYSFRSAHAPKEKQARVYLPEDQNHFGFFKTTRAYIDSYRVHYRDDLKNLTFLNKFMPVRNNNTGTRDITFYFSKNTLNRWKHIGREAVRIWNEGFLKAGSDIRLRIDETKTVDVGDIRYNILNLIDVVDNGNILGYGPTIVDTETGEIVSATSNIYVNPMREGLIGMMRNYVMYKQGILKKQYIGVNPNLTPMMDIGTLKANYAIYKELSKLKKNTKHNDQNLSSIVKNFKSKLTDYTQKLGMKNIDQLDQTDLSKYASKLHSIEIKKKGMGINGSCHNFGISYRDVIDELENKCPEVKAIGEKSERWVQDDELGLISTLNANIEVRRKAEMRIYEQCANGYINQSGEQVTGFLDKKILETLLHEMGHNLGLRHNFYASTDHINYHDSSVDERGVKVKSSSVMEYMPSQAYELRNIGKYDIAAIRFGYNNQIELLNEDDIHNPIVKNIPDLNKNIKQNASALNGKLHPYKYCTDEHVNLFDPLCTRHDVGKNAQEIVENTIHQYEAINAIHRYRNDRINTSMGISDALIGMTLVPLKTIYDSYRHELKNNLDSIDSGHLETFESADAFLKKRTSLILDKDNNIKNYKLMDLAVASEKITKFLKNLVFKPDNYCLVITKNQLSDRYGKVLSFYEVQREVYKKFKVTPQSCTEESVTKYFNSIGAKLVEQKGQDVTDRLESLDPKSLKDIFTGGRGGTAIIPINVVGFSNDRLFAMAVMQLREHLTLSNGFFDPKFIPNMLDEPQIRQDMTERIESRLIEGLKLKSNKTAQEIFPKYKNEMELLGNITNLMRNGANVPNDIITSQKRGSILSYVETTNPDVAQNIQTKMIWNGRYLGAYPGNTVSKKLIEEYQQIGIYKDLSKKVQFFPEIKQEFLDKLTGSEPLTLEEIKLMTLGDYIEKVVKPLVSLIQSLELMGATTEAYSLQQILTIEFTIMGLQFPPEELEKTMAVHLEEIFKEAYLYSKESMVSRLKDYNESQRPLLNVRLIDYRENEGDYLSKMNTILLYFGQRL